MADLLSGLPGPVEKLAVALCESLVASLGAVLYVKTIYVGVEIAGEMVAAMYPQADRVNIALALAEDHPSVLLEDATHLTWRSMPVLVSVGLDSDYEAVVALVMESAGRVANGEHSVLRSPEFFRGRLRRLTHDPRSGRPAGGS